MMVKDFSDYLRFGDDLIKLILEGVEKLQNIDEAAIEDDIFYRYLSSIALAISSINQLEATRLLLLNGLLQPSVVLSRSVFETSTLALYLIKNPGEAKNWATQKKISMSTVRKGLVNTVSYSLVYANLSEMSHPNLEASLPHMMKTEVGGVPFIAFALGGVGEKRKVKIAVESYIYICLLVAYLFIDSVFPTFGSPRKWSNIKSRLKKTESLALSKFEAPEHLEEIKKQFEEAKAKRYKK